MSAQDLEHTNALVSSETSIPIWLHDMSWRTAWCTIYVPTFKKYNFYRIV